MIGNVEMKYESNGNKSFITYSIKSRDDMDHVEMEMMRSNEIPGILSFSLAQSDGEISCCYDITSLTKLKGFLTQSQNRQQLFKMLEQIVSTLITAGDYMLDMEHFVLNTEYIYMQPGEKEIYFILLPVKAVPDEKVSLQSFLQNMLMDIQYDTTLDNGDFFIKVMNYVNSVQELDIQEFRQKIYQFMGMVKPSSKSRTGELQLDQIVPENNRDLSENRREPVVRPQQSPQSQPGSEDYFVQKRSIGSKEIKKGLFGRQAQNGDVNTEKAPKKEKRKKKQQEMPISEMVIPGENESMPAEHHEMEPAASGFEIPPAFGSRSVPVEVPKEKKKKKFLFHKKEEKIKEQKINGPIPNVGTVTPQIYTPAEETAFDNSFDQPVRMEGTAGMNNEQPAGMDMDRRQAAPRIMNADMLLNGKKNQKAPVQNTEQQIMAREVPGTILMEEQGDANPFLEYAKTGERVFITKDYFQIGRDPSYVDHVVDNPTVGRIHSFIITRGDRCYIIDNNSKNGTRLDKNRIVSNQEQLLKDGCEVEMGSEKFYFYSR